MYNGKYWLSGIAKKIAAAGYGVYAIDHPGFGLSEGLHGYVPKFSDMVDNVIEQYTRIKGMACSKCLCLTSCGLINHFVLQNCYNFICVFKYAFVSLLNSIMTRSLCF